MLCGRQVPPPRALCSKALSHCPPPAVPAVPTHRACSSGPCKGGQGPRTNAIWSLGTETHPPLILPTEVAPASPPWPVMGPEDGSR